MLKITNQDYFLPIVHALEANKVLSTGRTKPMIIRGVCEQSGERGEYVVKLKGANEMYPSSSLNEMLASFLALELDLQVPEPVLIHISQDFINTMNNRHENFNAASKSLGYNFGSALKNGYIEMIPGQYVTTGLKEKLQELFAFDVFIGNVDRRVDKPNFLSNGRDILIYDHELAFSFTQVLSFARNPNPWLIMKGDMEWIYNNYCYRQLKGTNIDFSNFAARLKNINDSFWSKAQSFIPVEWQNGYFNEIKNYLSKIVDNKDQFALELNRVLL